MPSNSKTKELNSKIILMKFLSSIVTELKREGYKCFEHVHDYMLIVGNCDKELNRSIVMPFPCSFNIQVGGGIKYYEDEMAQPSLVLLDYLHVLGNEVIETKSYSNQKLISIDYKIETEELSLDLGRIDSITRIWRKKTIETTEIFKPVLSPSSIEFLKAKLKAND